MQRSLDRSPFEAHAIFLSFLFLVRRFFTRSVTRPNAAARLTPSLHLQTPNVLAGPSSVTTSSASVTLDAARTSPRWVIMYILVYALYLLYAILFIYRTSFTIEGTRYFSLFDDAMVSMRYARNLAHGHGLVWNPGGERVEGYTNLLWVLIMSPVHLLPIPPEQISLVIQLLSASFLATNLFFVQKLSGILRPHFPNVSILAIFVTAFYLPLNNWALQGMEVGLLTLLLTTAVWLVSRSVLLNAPSLKPYLILAIGTLVRLDMSIPFVVILATHTLLISRHRTQQLIYACAVLLFFLLPQTLFRVLYYGDILPNTYYLKMTGYPLLLRITRGIYVFLEFILRANILFVLLPLVLLIRPSKPILLLLSVLGGQILYSIYVGGDAWEWWGGSNRYIVIAMPIFFVLFSHALWMLVDKIVTAGPNTVPMIRLRRQAVFLCVGMLAVVNFNSIYGPSALAEWLLLKCPLWTCTNAQVVRTALMVRELTTQEAKVAVVWAGILPYFAERHAVDLLGKNDKVIARKPMRVSAGLSRFKDFYPGHLKWDYAYSIGELRPDVIISLWGDREEAAPYLSAYRAIEVNGTCLWVRRGSSHVHWDRLVEAREARGGMC